MSCSLVSVRRWRSIETDWQIDRAAFLAWWKLPLIYHTRCRDIWVSVKMTLFPFETVSQTVDLPHRAFTSVYTVGYGTTCVRQHVAATKSAHGFPVLLFLGHTLLPVCRQNDVGNWAIWPCVVTVLATRSTGKERHGFVDATLGSSAQRSFLLRSSALRRRPCGQPRQRAVSAETPAASGCSGSAIIGRRTETLPPSLPQYRPTECAKIPLYFEALYLF